MNRKVSNLKLLALGVITLAILCVTLQPTVGDGKARVYMLDVGQGDSFLIQAADGAQLLIDGGKDASVLSELAQVMPRGDRSIDVVIATHPDADHIGGLPLVLERYDVGMYLTAEVSTDTQVFKDLNNLLAHKEIPAYYARHGMTLSLDASSVLPSSFSVLFPDRDTTDWETNSASVVGRLQMGKRSILFTGDSPSSVEAFLAKADTADIDVDILKLGHHGSKTSTSDIFLKATTPTLALISAGADNRYGHPAPEVVARLKSFGIKSLSTIDENTVTLSTDGEKWTVEK